MTRPLILIISPLTTHREAYHNAVQSAGVWWSLPADGPAHARLLLDKVRPALVIYDVAPDDEHLDPLHQSLHLTPIYEGAHLLLLGELAPARHPGASSGCRHCGCCPHCSRIYPHMEGAALVAAIRRVLHEGTSGEKYPREGEGEGTDEATSRMGWWDRRGQSDPDRWML